jgi:hypothetical protein
MNEGKKRINKRGKEKVWETVPNLHQAFDTFVE